MSGCAGAHPFLRRAFSESESKMKHEVGANRTCALKECKPKEEKF